MELLADDPGPSRVKEKKKVSCEDEEGVASRKKDTGKRP
jgi:hypothetical protein